MHPFCLRHLPQRGRFSLRSASELISISRHSAARISPSGGDAAAGGRRGVFPRASARLACFLTPVRAVFGFYHKRRPSMILKTPTTAADNGQPTKGRPFYGQAKGQLWLTWRSYAGPPQHIKLIAEGDTTPSEPSEPSEPCHAVAPWAVPLWWLCHHLCPGGKRVTGFSVAQGLPTNPVPLPPRKRWHNKTFGNPLHLPFLFDKIKKLEYKYTCPWISYLCPLTGWLWKKKRAEVINRRFLLCQLYP